MRFKRHRKFAAYLLGQFLGTVSSIFFRTTLNKSAHAITHRLHKAHTRTVYFLRVSTIISLFLVLTASLSYGASISWTGTSSSSWSDPANWSGGVVPGPGDDVTIPWLPGSASQPVIDVDASIASLSMASNPNTLTVASGINVTISGNATVGNSATFDANGGNVTVGGQLSINGNLTMSAGSVTTNSISINGGSSIDVNDGHLTIDSPSTINGDINLGSGTIDFLGDLIFKGTFNVIDGTVNVGTSSAGATFDLSGSAQFNLNDGTLNVYGPSTLTGSGALDVTGGSINFYDNSTFSGSGKLNAGSGDIYFAQDVTLSGSGTINAESSTIIMDGNTWDMSGGSNFNPGTSTVVFSGGTQLITGSGGVKDITFYNLTVNNGAQVTSDIDVIVTNSMNVVPPATFNVTPGNTITANSSISITQQPVSQEVCEGSTATFTVAATGATSYQWRKNSVDISGATSNTLTINNASSSDEATYDCVISNSSGTVYSDQAGLTVDPIPSLSLTASATSVCLGESLTLKATSSGGSPDLTGENTTSYNIPSTGSPLTVTSTIAMPSTALASASNLEVHINLDHTYAGDLKVTLTGPGSIGTTTLFDRVGYPQSTWGNSDDFVSSADYVFSTSGATVLPESPNGTGEIPPGTYKPSDANGNAHDFSGLNFPISDVAGGWTLSVSDEANGDGGTLHSWSITVYSGGTYTTYFSGPANIGSVSYAGITNSTATVTVTPTASGVLNYTATTSDPSGCSATSAPVSITVNALPALTATPSDADFGQTNGSISATASGGVTPYQYSLDSGPYQASGDFTNLSPGTYTITVQDASGCTTSSSVDVNEKPDTEAPQFTNCSNDTTVIADPTTCTAKVWYNIPTATDNGGAYAGALTGFSYLGDYNGHSYYISTDLQLSVDAHVTVFDNGGHLATIGSAGENAFLSGFATARHQDVWFGFTDAAQEGTFRWVTGEPITYTNWNAGEPNNSSNNEDWAEMYGTNPSIDGKWNDQYNTDTRYFFLEFDGPRVIGEMQNEGDPTWYPAPAPGSTFTTGIHHMRFTATDASGNTSICSFDIIVDSGLNLAFSNPEQRVCANETGVTYTLNQTLDSYVWNVTGGNISAGGGTNDNYVTVNWGTGPDGKVTATGANTGGCSETVSTNVHIIQPVAYTPSPDTTICSGSTAHLRITLPVDSAMQFDGSSHISIPNDNSINLQAVSNRTVSLWFKANNTSSRQVLYEEGGGVNGFSIYIENDQIFVHAWESNSTWTPTGSEIKKSINPNTWYNVAFVYDGNASDGIYFKGYLDGEYIGGISDAVAAGDMNAHSGDINIGTSSNIRYPDNSTDGGNNFTGEIDEFKLWNSSLTESEIFSEQYNNTFTSNEIVHYTFNSDNGTTLVDETGGNDGTLNGTTHVTDAPFRPTVSWSPGGGAGTTNDVSPTVNTTYTYTLTEPLLGCTTSGSIAVTVNKVSLSASVTDETCTGSGNGAINLTPSGGVTPYSYVWSTADGSGLNGSSEDQTGLAPGTYDVVVTDANGCSATGSYTVATVPDVTNPTITAPSDINQVADNGVCTAAVSVPNPTYSDNCSVASLLWEMTGATVDNSAGSGINSVGTYTFNKGTTTITWIVTDAAGNSAQASMNVTVTDDQNPTITAPTDVSVSADAGSCLATSVALGSPTTSDNCGVGSVTNDAPATFPKGTTVVTWTVTDNSGNIATATQNVTVTDDEKPVIADLSDLSTSVCASDETASPQYEVVNGIGLPAGRISDNCSSTFTITYTISGATTVTNGTGDASGTTFYEGISTVTYYVKDESGNISDGKSFTVTVDHKPNPGNVIAN